jgi:hypothetical protein
LDCSASAAIKCAPCEQVHRPCSWVADYRRWRIKQVWEVDDEGLDRLELAATVAGSASSRKVDKVAPRSSNAGASASATSPSPVRTASGPSSSSVRVVIPSAATPRKRPRRPEDERIVLKVPRKTMATTTAATATAAASTEANLQGLLPRDHEGLVEKLGATERDLEVAQEELSRLRQQLQRKEEELDAQRQRALEWAASARTTADRLRVAETRVAQLEGVTADARDEVEQVRHALAQASAQQSSRRVEQLQRRLERESFYFTWTSSRLIPICRSRSEPQSAGGLACSRGPGFPFGGHAVGRQASGHLAPAG